MAATIFRVVAGSPHRCCFAASGNPSCLCRCPPPFSSQNPSYPSIATTSLESQGAGIGRVGHGHLGRRNGMHRRVQPERCTGTQSLYRWGIHRHLLSDHPPLHCCLRFSWSEGPISISRLCKRAGHKAKSKQGRKSVRRIDFISPSAYVSRIPVRRPPLESAAQLYH